MGSNKNRLYNHLKWVYIFWGQSVCMFIPKHLTQMSWQELLAQTSSLSSKWPKCVVLDSDSRRFNFNSNTSQSDKKVLLNWWHWLFSTFCEGHVIYCGSICSLIYCSCFKNKLDKTKVIFNPQNRWAVYKSQQQSSMLQVWLLLKLLLIWEVLGLISKFTNLLKRHR